MVLESDIECLSKAIHVIVFSVKPDFYIGRRIKDNDITISDISVSRKQAGIKLIGNKVIVEDCESKFGTFVRVFKPIPITRDYPLPIQIEKKIFFFKLSNRFNCFHCLNFCGLLSSKDEQYDHYRDVKGKFQSELEKYF